MYFVKIIFMLKFKSHGINVSQLAGSDHEAHTGVHDLGHQKKSFNHELCEL